MHEYIFADQVMRSGTSIGANLSEGRGAQSRADFMTKISIAFKESRECHYWLRLLKESGTIQADMLEPLIQECEELLKMLAASHKTHRANND